MPANAIERAYLDSNVLLALVQNENGRADVVQGLLEDARHGRIEAITSVLTVTEVAFAAVEIAGGNLDTEASDAIDTLWEPASPITVVDASMVTSRKARALIREAKNRGFTLKPYDAQHLAAAVLHEATRVFTYEDATTRAKWSDLLGIPVEEPFTTQPGML
jgi:predicted nucleic acid-binding protein